MPKQQSLRYQVGDYIIGRTLGEGTYAKVKYGQHAETGEPVAIKVLDKAQIERAHMAGQIKHEVRIMRRLKHPNVVELKDVMATKSKVYVVLELMTGGELFEKIALDGPLTEAAGRRVFQQLLDGLAHCHAHGVYHRDLKLENILMAADGTVKLSDFGLGSLQESGGDGMLRTVCGTPNYAAPEVLLQQPYDGSTADLWSLGVCLYVILAGCLPFESASMPELLRRIQRGQYETPPWMSPAAARVIDMLLQPDPQRRATIQQLRRDPWVAADYKPARALGSQRRPGLESRTLDRLFDPSVVMKSVKQPDDGWGTVPRDGGRPLNAFEIINAALDISALFERRSDVVKRHTRFTSRESPERIAEEMEAAHTQLGGTSERNSFKSMPKLRMTITTAHGQLTVVVDILTIIPGLHMVELHKGAAGDAASFYQYYSELLPLLSSIVHRSSFQPASLARLSAGIAPPLPEPISPQPPAVLGLSPVPADLRAVSPPESPIQGISSPIPRATSVA